MKDFNINDLSINIFTYIKQDLEDFNKTNYSVIDKYLNCINEEQLMDRLAFYWGRNKSIAILAYLIEIKKYYQMSPIPYYDIAEIMKAIMVLEYINF